MLPYHTVLKTILSQCSHVLLVALSCSLTVFYDVFYCLFVFPMPGRWFHQTNISLNNNQQITPKANPPGIGKTSKKRVYVNIYSFDDCMAVAWMFPDWRSLKPTTPLNKNSGHWKATGPPPIRGGGYTRYRF